MYLEGDSTFADLFGTPMVLPTAFGFDLGQFQG
jgi:hypothetical protein